jgi:GNAT superfamily N-acetyltransferase
MALSTDPDERTLPRLTWRAMTAADLDAVAAIALVAFPDHFEGRDCFANRLALNPSGCFVLAEGDGPPRGYLVAYPWPARSAPKLNVLIDALPRGEVMYLHDLALHPDVRGRGWTRPIVERLASDARAAGWPALALVAVNDAAPFWSRHGFKVVGGEGLDWLSGYGPEARYMVRPLA